MQQEEVKFRAASGTFSMNTVKDIHRTARDWKSELSTHIKNRTYTEEQVPFAVLLWFIKLTQLIRRNFSRAEFDKVLEWFRPEYVLSRSYQDDFITS